MKVAGAIIFFALGLWAWNWLNEPRQSALRAGRLAELKQIELALVIYKEAFSIYPICFDSLTNVTDKVPSGFELTGRQDGLLVYDSRPCRAVKKGESWGGLGDTAERDFPAVRLILLNGEGPQTIEESEFQKEYGSLIHPPH